MSERQWLKHILPANDWWRIVGFDLSDANNFVDWTHEREWRLPGDFDFAIEEATVLVPNSDAFKEFFELAASDGEDVSTKVRSVISLGSIYL